MNSPSLGYRLTFQRFEGCEVITVGTSCEEIGSLFGVWRCDVNFASVFLHAGCALVGMYLVLHRPNRCRQWGENFLIFFFAGKLIWTGAIKNVPQVQYSWLWKLANVTQSPYSYIWSNDTRLPELVNGPSRRTMYITALYFTMTCMTSVRFSSY